MLRKAKDFPKTKTKTNFSHFVRSFSVCLELKTIRWNVLQAQQGYFVELLVKLFNVLFFV